MRLQAELRDVTGGKVTSDSHRQDLQARLAALGREKGEVEAELRQVGGDWVGGRGCMEPHGAHVAASGLVQGR